MERKTPIFKIQLSGWACAFALLSVKWYLGGVLADLHIAQQPLYNVDPHNVRSPMLPEPFCFSKKEQAFDIDLAMPAASIFCMTDTSVISASSREPISTSLKEHNGLHDIWLVISWDKTLSCQRSLLEFSPDQGGGRICGAIFRSIIFDCTLLPFLSLQDVNC